MRGNTDPQKLWHTAVSEYNNGHPDRAIKAITPLLNHPAANGETFLLAGLINGQLGNWGRAKPLLIKAIELLPSHVDAWLAMGTAHHMSGEMDEAIVAFNKAKDIDGNCADAWNNLGVVNEDTGKFVQALQCFDRTIELSPDHSQALHSRASVLGRLRRFEESRMAYEDLIQRNPDDSVVAVSYAEFLEQSNRPEESKHFLPDPNGTEDPVTLARIAVVKSKLLARENAYDEALKVVQAVQKKTGESFPAYRAGILLDRLGRYEEAMQAFKKANQGRSHQRNFRRVLQQKVTEFLDFKIAQGISVHNNPENISHRAVTFVTGLPRSGTTLLDRMLAAHPDIQVLEELEGLRMTEAAIAAGESVNRAREIYWEFVSQHEDLDDSKLIVDKNPLHVMHLDMIPKIFPHAKVVLALRHPYDAALSCFMQDFEAGPVTARFLELKSTAKVCSQFLKLMQNFESAWPDHVWRVRYEDLVVDFQSEITELLNFIGLEWHEDIADYAAEAASAKPIMTASYEQVTRKLYSTSVERWKNYEPWLKPFRTMLGPTLETFGYND